MNKIYYGFFLILILLFSGCAGSNSQNNPTPVQINGEGLKMDFQTDEKFITVRQIDYILTLENTGLEPVVLTKNNFKLTTVNKVGSNSVFDQASVDKFYNTLFKSENSLTIYRNQKITGVIGSLFVNEDFFKLKTQENFEYILSTKYDYKTSFSNNLQLDFKSSNLITILDPVSQAAPVKITKIELSPLSTSDYVLKYYLSDKGQSSANDRTVSLKNVNILFRTTQLSSCKGLVFKDGTYKEVGIESLKINKEMSEVIVACKVSFTDADKASKFITTTSGSFEYTYQIDIKKTINLPQKSADQIVWQ